MEAAIAKLVFLGVVQTVVHAMQAMDAQPSMPLRKMYMLDAILY